MTAPAVGGLDPRIVQNLRIMQQRGMTADIPTYLRDIEGVDPSLYTRGPDLKQQFTHGAGLIARMGIQGVGNLASLPFGMAGAAYQGVTGRQPPAMLQGNQGTAAANQMGLPQPQGAGERIATAAGENAVTAGILPGGAGMAALGAGAGAAGQGVQEAGGSPMAQMAASAAVGMGIPVVATLGAAAIRSALAGASARRAAAQQSLALLQAGGQDAGASLGQVAEGGIAKTLQGGLKNVPGATEVFREAGAKQASSMKGRVESIADRMGSGGTPTTAGQAVQKGIEEGYIPRFKTTANNLYAKVFALVPPETPIVPAASVRLATQMDDLVSAARPLSDHIAAPKVVGILSDLAATVEQNPGGVPFGVLKELRSRMGAMLNGDELVADVNLRDVKRLYGALSEDMRRGIAVHELGPEGAAAAGVPGSRLAEFDAAAARQTSRLVASGTLTPKVVEALKQVDNLGFDTPLQAANAILGEQRPGGWASYWDVSDSPQAARVIEAWRNTKVGTTGPAPAAPVTSGALAAWDRAEKFWANGSEKISNILQPLMDKNVPEKAFTALLSGTKEGATALQGTMRSLSPAERGLVSSTVLRNLGKANPAAQDAAGQVFSPETYLTNWNKLAPEARSALFDNAGAGIHEDLNKLAKAVELRRKAANVLPNASGTAPNTAFWSILAGLSTSAGGAVLGNPGVMAAGLAPAAAAGGANLAARAFTNPRIVNWLVRQTRMPFGAMSQELLILAKDAEKWPPEDREVAQDLKQTLSNVNWNMVLLAHAAADATSQRQQ